MSEETLPQSVDDARLAAGLRLASLALPRFGIEADAQLDPLPLSENVALSVSPRGRAPVVLRISRAQARTEGELRSELEWINALRTQSAVPVAGVVATLDGRSVVTLEDPATGQVYSLAVFEHVPGHEPDEAELPSVLPSLGRISAQLHEHSSQWQRPSWFTRGRWDLTAAFGPAPRWGDWRVGVPDPAQRRLLERTELVICERLRKFGTGPDRFGLIHADLRTANLLVDGDDCRVIDFDDCGFGWWLYDLATALTFYENHPDCDEMIAAWIGGYREIRPLSDVDEAEIPTLLLFRRLLTLAFLAGNAEIAVSREMLPALPAQTCDLAESYLLRFG